MPRENRDVRPFVDLAELESMWEECVTIRALPKTSSATKPIICPAWSTQRIEPQTLATADVHLHMPTEQVVMPMLKITETFAKSLGLKDASAFSVVLHATSPFLRFTDELLRCTMDEIERWRGGLSLAGSGKRPRSLQLPHHGTRFDLMVVLNRTLNKSPGMPWRLGTWLAHLQFTFANPAEGIGFTPMPLTDELREEFGVSRGSLFYPRVKPSQPDWQRANYFDDFGEIYVDSDVLDHLAASPREHQSALIQTQIFLHALNFLVMEFQRDERRDTISIAEINDGLMGRLLRVVSGESQDELEAWLEVLRREPTKFMAALESASDIKNVMRRGLGTMRAGA